MRSLVKLFSNNVGDIYNFLIKFLNFVPEENPNVSNFKGYTLPKFDALEWEQSYNNPIEIVDIIGAFIENNDKYNISMWVSLDEDALIYVTNVNADALIRYLYERFPY